MATMIGLETKRGRTMAVMMGLQPQQGKMQNLRGARMPIQQQTIL